MPEIEKPLKSNKMEENVDKWDADFIDLEDSILYQIVTASNYLMIQPLLDLAYPQFLNDITIDHISFTPSCAKIASYIKGKSAEEIRQHFHIENDFTKEEEERVVQRTLLNPRYGKITNGQKKCFLFVPTNNARSFSRVVRKSRGGPSRRSHR